MLNMLTDVYTLLQDQYQMEPHTHTPPLHHPPHSINTLYILNGKSVYTTGKLIQDGTTQPTPTSPDPALQWNLKITDTLGAGILSFVGRLSPSRMSTSHTPQPKDASVEGCDSQVVKSVIFVQDWLKIEQINFLSGAFPLALGNELLKIGQLTRLQFQSLSAIGDYFVHLTVAYKGGHISQRSVVH